MDRVSRLFVKRDILTGKRKVVPVGWLIMAILGMMTMATLVGAVRFATGGLKPVASKLPAPPTMREPTATPYTLGLSPVETLAVVTADGLNVGQEPSTSWDVLEVVERGEELVVLEEKVSPGWLYIKTPQGTTGWVRGDYVSITEQKFEPFETEPSEREGYRCRWIGDEEYMVLDPAIREQVIEDFLGARHWFWDGASVHPSRAERFFVNAPPAVEVEPQKKYIADPKLLDVIVQGLQNSETYWKITSMGEDEVEILAFSKDGKIAALANRFPKGIVRRVYSFQTRELVREKEDPPGWYEVVMFYDEGQERWKVASFLYREGFDELNPGV